ncbi:MAG: 2-oxoglutarate dehydrogenase complex dihydrolipoyllysine-residue succinyltransferase [Zetaproteobacteria bacterium]|nr:2-oxoglutarate dehydrogenase complex dihydrolipoyllysine-residue succinyltransferase [Zetaproteobacteria bacterium]
MAVEVKVPAVGESVQEGMIESWHKENGEWVEQDEILLELETDKATVEIVAESAGKLSILQEAGTVVQIGDVIGTLEPSAEREVSSIGGSPDPATASPQVAVPVAEEKDPGPAARKVLSDAGVSAAGHVGHGKDGRLTKEDAVKLVQSQGNVQSSPNSSPQAPVSAAAASSLLERQDQRKPMSMMRRRIAERLLQAQEQAAILTTFNEVDMTEVMALRSRYKEDFVKKFDMKLGFMGFFLRASVSALKAFPAVNAYIEGTDVIYHNYCDIGVAVSTPKGLMVPVVRDVDKRTIAGIEKEIARYASKARENKISLDDLEGGTFTVSNGGVFGSLLSTPILNPPQSAILGMHKTQMRPMVMPDGSIAARPMMYLALSYDHRIVDGKEAVGFLVKIKEAIEDPSRLLLEV